MSPVIVGLIGLGILILVFTLRMPVAFALMITGFSGMLYFLPPQAAFRFLATDIFGQFSSYPLSAIPMLVLMGCFASAAGITIRLYDVVYVWMGWMRGGLGAVSVFASMIFGGISGSSVADAAGFIMPESEAELLADRGDVTQVAGGKRPVRRVIMMIGGVSLEDGGRVKLGVEGNGEQMPIGRAIGYGQQIGLRRDVVDRRHYAADLLRSFAEVSYLG
jgi:hypothetical protein